jgi:CheY-like chemotaxis protein
MNQMGSLLKFLYETLMKSTSTLGREMGCLKHQTRQEQIYQMRWFEQIRTCSCPTDASKSWLQSDNFKLSLNDKKLFMVNLQMDRWPMDTEKVKNILCIEDDTEMIDLIRLILGRRGFEVTGAGGGAEGLKKIREQHPDLVLLDLMMPDMDGWEVYQQMKADEKTRDIPVIVVTAKAQSIDRVLGMHIAKVDDYITKPFSPQELLNSVEKVLSQQIAH